MIAEFAFCDLKSTLLFSIEILMEIADK